MRLAAAAEAALRDASPRHPTAGERVVVFVGGGRCDVRGGAGRAAVGRAPRLWVVARAADEAKLRAAFGQYGVVEKVFLLPGNAQRSAASAHYSRQDVQAAFVTMATIEEAQAALAGMQDRKLDEGDVKRLIVRVANQRSAAPYGAAPVRAGAGGGASDQGSPMLARTAFAEPAADEAASGTANVSLQMLRPRQSSHSSWAELADEDEKDDDEVATGGGAGGGSVAAEGASAAPIDDDLPAGLPPPRPAADAAPSTMAASEADAPPSPAKQKMVAGRPPGLRMVGGRWARHCPGRPGARAAARPVAAAGARRRRCVRARRGGCPHLCPRRWLCLRRRPRRTKPPRRRPSRHRARTRTRAGGAIAAGGG